MLQMPEAVCLGDRLQLSDFRGTVRFIGTVHDQPGKWVGIEWDDLSRGKHNGTFKGTRYFQTKSDLPSATFVPWTRLYPGVSLVSAVQARYTGLQLTQEDSDVEEEMFVSTTSNKAKRIELVGKNKVENQQKKTHLLQSVDLSGACITQTGALDELAMVLQSLVELNVSFNFIRKWDMVVDIVQSLPALKILNLSGNPFLKSNQEPTALSTKSESNQLNTLILNECDMDWNQAVQVVNCLSAVTELQVCLNEISSLTTPNPQGHTFHNLQIIDFAYNGIEQWEDVCQLSSMPSLKKLNLSSNLLQSVYYVSDQPGFFALLETLLLGDCLIDNWDSINALNQFPKLKETRISGNPLLQSITGGGRFEIIARVGALVQLNASRVSKIERIDCERRYISQVANSTLLDSQQDSKDALRALHPRYEELVAKHGAPSASVTNTRQTGALKESMIEVTLSCHAPSAGNHMGSQTKKLSLNMTLGSLRTLVEKLFTVPKHQIKLFLRSDEAQFAEDISDLKDDRKLRDLYLVVTSPSPSPFLTNHLKM